VKRSADEYVVLLRLLDEALDLPEEARGGWVDQLSGLHAELRPALRRLLLAKSAPGTGAIIDLQSYVAAVVRDAAPQPETHSLQAGEHVGPYELVREIGRGGMGLVWLANRADGAFRRSVALKLPHVTWAGSLGARMVRERDILASLEHPNIARFYDAGVDALGRPFMAMEYVEGQAIDVYCAELKLSIRERLALVLDVAKAVAYAHSKLVVHRDLKPANMLVTTGGAVRLLDFGIAKLIEGETIDGAQLTQMSGRLLTPDYASPEQIRGEAIGTASDVYSLAVVTYELLTGTRPYRLKRQSAAELEEAIAEVDPRLASEAADDKLRRRQLRGDLDAILNKAMKKSPGDRYITVDAFAGDLQRYLAGETVQARPDSRWYRTGKSLRRHWVGAAAAGVVLIAIMSGGVVAVWQARIARTEAVRAEAVQDFLVSIFRANSRDQSNPLRAQATTARELLDAGAARLRSSGGAALPLQARDQLELVILQLYDELGMYGEAAALGQDLVASLRTRGAGAESQLANALVELAESLQQTEQSSSALPLLREAEAISARHPSDEKLAAYVASYLANQLTNIDPDAGTRYAERAAALFRRVEPRGDEMLGALMMIATTKRPSDPVAAENAASEALQLVATTRGANHQLYGETALVLADIQTARMKDAADATFRAADAVAQRVTEPGHYLRLQTDLRYGMFLADRDLGDEAATRLNRALAAATAARGPDDPIYVAWAHEYLARTAWRRGNLDEARRQADEALRIYRRGKPDDVIAKVAELAFDIALARGERVRAHALLDEARAGRTQTGTIRQLGFREAIAAREGWLALADGDAVQALRHFNVVADTAVPRLQRFVEVKIGARIGVARAERQIGQAQVAIAQARAALTELEQLGNPVPLRPSAALAWIELAADALASGDSKTASEARLKAANLIAATDDAASFRRTWVN
jgi:eukaryotic-like serine/threonine-protein kinase